MDATKKYSGDIEDNNRIGLIDSLRGLLCAYIFIHHLFEKETSFSYLLFKQGQFAVIAFFILSGYIIKKISFNKYSDSKFKFIFNRAIKIYSQLFFALLVSIIIALYKPNIEWSYSDLLANVVGLQDLNRHPGYLFHPFLRNTPLWSLSYECWFYGLFIFFWNYKKVGMVAVFSIMSMLIFILFPNQILLFFAYFLIWWSGVLLAERENFKYNYYNLLSALILMMLILASQVKEVSYRAIMFYPWIQLRHFFSTILILFFTKKIESKTKFLRFLEKILIPFKVFAPISFSFYLLHYVVIIQNTFNNEGRIIYLNLVFLTIFCLILSYLSEQIIYKKYISQLLLR